LKHTRHARDCHGGPQVIDEAANTLIPADERTLVCNAEGERTFSNVLKAIIDGNALYEIGGISAYHNGEIVTNPDEARIKTLDDIP
jgi:hypothetical protein